MRFYEIREHVMNKWVMKIKQSKAMKVWCKVARPWYVLGGNILHGEKTFDNINNL